MNQPENTSELGAPLAFPTPSSELRWRLSSRRSAPAQSLSHPGPSAAELDEILNIGARTPDHGKLFPWRFVVLGTQSRADLAERLKALAMDLGLPTKAQAVLAKLRAAPVTILVISTAKPGSKPIWEQQLSAGAVCMNLEHAANAFGYSASWITDWYSYEPEALALFEVQADEKVAGFIHIGTVTEPLLERVRPDLKAITSYLP
jgi:nitroreductase